MKHIFSLLFATSFPFFLLAQGGVAINTDNSDPDASAILDVKSTTQGVLIPRMTDADKTAIIAPATGLLIYQTDGTAGFYYYDGIDWVSISNGWGIAGNAGTTAGTNFVGTTDAQGLMFKTNDIQSGYIDILRNNTSLGQHSLIANTTGSNNVANGYQALYSNTTGILNVAVGYQSLYSNTTGNYNTATGMQALWYNTTGNYNTATGRCALLSNTTGNGNTAIGNTALYSNTTGDGNTATGSAALFSNTTGVDNTATGQGALRLNTIGNYNTAMGYAALVNNDIGSYNTALGHNALRYNTTGNNNTATGYRSLYANTTGNNNVSTGFQALRDNTTGVNNVANGYQALRANTTSNNNVAIGYQTLRQNITGNNNVALGGDAGNSYSTGSSNTFLGYNTDATTDGLTNATAIGANATVNASNKVRIGDAAVTVIEGQVAYSFPSDKRFKFNVQEDVPGLDFINKLKPVTYNFDTKKFADFINPNAELPQGATAVDYTESTHVKHTGFLAQDIEAICKELGYDFDGLNIPKNDNENYSVAYSQFVMPLVKAVQELDAKNKVLEAKVNELDQIKAELAEIKASLNANANK